MSGPLAPANLPQVSGGCSGTVRLRVLAPRRAAEAAGERFQLEMTAEGRTGATSDFFSAPKVQLAPVRPESAGWRPRWLNSLTQRASWAFRRGFMTLFRRCRSHTPGFGLLIPAERVSPRILGRKSPVEASAEQKRQRDPRSGSKPVAKSWFSAPKGGRGQLSSGSRGCSVYGGENEVGAGGVGGADARRSRNSAAVAFGGEKEVAVGGVRSKCAKRGRTCAEWCRNAAGVADGVSAALPLAREAWRTAWASCPTGHGTSRPFGRTRTRSGRDADCRCPGSNDDNPRSASGCPRGPAVRGSGPPGPCRSFGSRRSCCFAVLLVDVLEDHAGLRLEDLGRVGAREALIQG